MNSNLILRAALGLTALVLNLDFIPRAEAGHFTTTASLNTARYGHTATLLPNGKVLVVGGQNDTNYLANAELYDPASGKWTATDSMSTRRGGFTATLLLNGRVLVAGGLNNSAYLGSAEIYDPIAGTWTQTGNLNYCRHGHTATLLPDGRVLVGGGLCGNPMASAEVYDPSTGSWIVVSDMTDAIAYGQSATLLNNGQVLVAGGCCPPLSSAEVYEPATWSWTLTGLLIEARYAHAAAFLANEEVLVVGGYGTNYGVALSSAEIYDPATGTWASVASLVTARVGPTATVMTNGQVLVAGGRYFIPSAGTSASLSSAELFDPGLGKWLTTGPLATSRAGHTATLLPNGQVLIAGGAYSDGSSPNAVALASAELYVLGTGSSSPIVLASPRRLAGGGFQFGFTNAPGVSFSVLATTDPSAPFDSWAALGDVPEISPGQFRFTDQQATNYLKRYYRVRSPSVLQDGRYLIVT